MVMRIPARICRATYRLPLRHVQLVLQHLHVGLSCSIPLLLTPAGRHLSCLLCRCVTTVEHCLMRDPRHQVWVRLMTTGSLLLMLMLLLVLRQDRRLVML